MCIRDRNNTAFFVVVVGIVGAVSQFMGQMAPILSGSMEPLVGNVVATSVRLFGGSLIAAGVATFLAASLVLWLLSAIGACVSYGGFRACRRDNRIEVEHGLLQHRFQGVDVDRVQSVMVKQSFIRRLLGYCELSLGKICLLYTSRLAPASLPVNSSKNVIRPITFFLQMMV